MSVASSLDIIRKQLPANIKLVAVSKFHPAEAVIDAYNLGQKTFGESRVQELDEKAQKLPSDIEWHQIGHLQTNKIKYIIPYIHTIQSVDSWKVLDEINKHASLMNRTINCLLEIKIAEEDTKFGFSFDECRTLLSNKEWKKLSNIKICGVMGMATYTDNELQIRKEFKSLKIFFDELKDTFFAKNDIFCEISMGMSHDFLIAIEEGATIVRIGTSIFGEREY